jgi:hypothetical protein
VSCEDIAFGSRLDSRQYSANTHSLSQASLFLIVLNFVSGQSAVLQSFMQAPSLGRMPCLLPGPSFTNDGFNSPSTKVFIVKQEMRGAFSLYY